MGRAIFYCVQCSQRVSEGDLDSGKAFRIGDRILCGACAPPGTPPSTSKKIPVPPPKLTGGTPVRGIPAAPPMAPPPDRSRSLPLIIGGVVAALVLVIVPVRMMRRPPAPPPPTGVLPEIKVPPKPPPEVVRPEEPGRAELEKARALARKSPEDLSAHLRAYTDIVWKFE